MKRTAATQTQRGGIELSALKQGYKIVGVDEVGRGCIAGPVYAACVLLDFEQLFKLPDSERLLIRDSKQLSSQARAKILPQIEKISLKVAIGVASVEEIERINILQATFLAMRRALLRAHIARDHLLLVDGNQKIPDYDGLQRSVINGDHLCYSIAAASILAKEARDHYMRIQGEIYPNYGFAHHVGYGTPAHIKMISRYGPCPIHRKTFEPIRSYIAKFGEGSSVTIS